MARGHGAMACAHRRKARWCRVTAKATAQRYARRLYGNEVAAGRQWVFDGEVSTTSAALPRRATVEAEGGKGGERRRTAANSSAVRTYVCSSSARAKASVYQRQQLYVRWRERRGGEEVQARYAAETRRWYVTGGRYNVYVTSQQCAYIGKSA